MVVGKKWVVVGLKWVVVDIKWVLVSGRGSRSKIGGSGR